MGNHCSVEGCDRLAEARGCCHAHLLRLVRLGDVWADQPLQARRRRPVAGRPPDVPLAAPPAPAGKPCSVEACGRPAAQQGLCSGHVKRLQRTGSV